MTLSTLWQILFWAWTASELLLALATYARPSSGPDHDRGSLRILWLVLFGSISLGTRFAGTHPHTLFHAAPWLRPAGAGLFLLGLLIRWTAILSLGRSFTVRVAISATQTVHRAGLYSLVRHPSYTGLLLILLAIGLGTGNPISLAILILPTTAALLYRIHVEEIALNAAFGPEYAAYSRTTRRLIPGLY